jgi:hypothetical protein
LGLRQPHGLREYAGLGSLVLAKSVAACCKEGWHYQADRLAYLPAHLQFAVVGIRQRREGGAGADAAREDLHNHGDLYACPNGEEAEAQSKVVDALFLRERMEMVAS